MSEKDDDKKQMSMFEAGDDIATHKKPDVSDLSASPKDGLENLGEKIDIQKLKSGEIDDSAVSDETRTLRSFDNLGKTVFQKNIDVVMHESMMPYSECVILDRALPRVEDGLKPVQRRILYTMLELGVTPDKPHRKSARIVGDCLGKYHPHGDRSVYDAMVRMAQEFNMREKLVDGHGNFGSVDGDGAAAMRYTEARMAPLALEMLRDLDKNTVPWELNFDDSLKEPVLLPSRFPNLLVNGTTGIAVGLATNIPPHNLNEVISGVCAFIDNRDISLTEMMKFIKAPDFPTGGFVIGGDELVKAYETGRGKVTMRAKVHVETLENDKKNIVISELPYQVNKANLLQKILELRESKKDLLSGISEICDESDRMGMRAVVRVKKDADVDKILAVLFKYTELQCTFGINMVAIADGRPQQMGLLDIIAYYVDFQREVVVRRTKFDLDAARERAHILEGLVIAVSNIDEVVRIIKKSANVGEARAQLKTTFNLSERQAQAVLDMRLARLTSLEVEKLQNELAELKKKIEELQKILNSRKLQFEIIKTELGDIARRFKGERRTRVLDKLDDFAILKEEDLKVVESCVVFGNLAGGLKRLTTKQFSSASKQFSEKTTDSDLHNVVIQTMSNKTLIGFTNLGNAVKLIAENVPEAKWRDKGSMLSSILPGSGIVNSEKIVALFEYSPNNSGDLLFFTKDGMVKRTSWNEYSLQKNVYLAIKLKDGDSLISVEPFSEFGSMVFVSKKGMCLNAMKNDIPVQGRVSGGVKGVSIGDGDKLLVAGQASDSSLLALVSDKGFAKKVKTLDIDLLARYRKGVKVFDLKGNSGSKLVAGVILKQDEDVDIVFDENSLFTCYSTSVFDIETRTSKGRSLTKSKNGLSIQQTFVYKDK